MNIENISQVVGQFLCHVDLKSIRVYGSGHINDTYFLKNQNATCRFFAPADTVFLKWPKVEVEAGETVLLYVDNCGKFMNP